MNNILGDVDAVRYPENEPGIVVEITKISRSDNQYNTKVMKIKILSYRSISIGDKISTRCGCKGVVAKVTEEKDMPSCNGVKPDVIVNTTAIPTRMVLNQIFEIPLSRIAYYHNITIDVSAFSPINPQSIVAGLSTINARKYKHMPLSAIFDPKSKKKGSTFTPNDIMNPFTIFKNNWGNMDQFGNNQMYSSDTGKPMPMYISIGYNCLIRINKFAIEMSIIINEWSKLKAGEMEKDVLAATSPHVLLEKFYTDADGTFAFICSCCGGVMVVYEYDKIKETFSAAKCSRCSNVSRFYKVYTTQKLRELTQYLQQSKVSVRAPPEASSEVIYIE